MLGVVLCAACVFDQAPMLGTAMNADMLVPFSYAWDVASHAYGWHSYQLPRLPSLVPDVALLAPMLLLGLPFRWVMLLYGTLQALLLVWAAGGVASWLSGRRLRGAASVFFGLLALDVFQEIWTGGGSIVLNAFLPFDHFGPFILSVVGGMVAVAQLAAPTRGGLAFTGFVSALVFLGDQLLLVEFAAPLAGVLAVALLAGLASWRRVSAVAAALLLGGLVGRIGFGAMNRAGLRFEAAPPMSAALFSAAARAFVARLPGFVEAHAAGLATGLFLPLAVFAAYPWLLRASVRRGALDAATAWQRGLLWGFAALAMAGSLVFTMCISLDDQGARYALALWIWPLVFVAAVLLHPRVSDAWAGVPAAAAALAFLAMFLGPHHRAVAVLAWRHDLASCLEQVAAARGLHAGLAQYWEARPLELSTGWSVQVDQVTETGGAYVWANDVAWYRHSFADARAHPRYDFLVMRRLSPGGVLARFGPPDETVPCSGTEFWIYRDTDALYARLLASSSGLAASKD